MPVRRIFKFFFPALSKTCLSQYSGWKLVRQHAAGVVPSTVWTLTVTAGKGCCWCLGWPRGAAAHSPAPPPVALG